MLFRSVAAPILWGLTFMLVLATCLGLERAGRWPGNRFTAWLATVGVFSYSLYLVHLPLISSMRYVLSRWIMRDDPAIYLTTAALIVMAGYVAGRVFFAVVEQRFIKYPWSRPEDRVTPIAEPAIIPMPQPPTPAPAHPRAA